MKKIYQPKKKDEEVKQTQKILTKKKQEKIRVVLSKKVTLNDLNLVKTLRSKKESGSVLLGISTGKKSKKESHSK